MKFIFQALSLTTVRQSKNYTFFFLSHMEETPARLGQDSNRGRSTVLTLHLIGQETELSLSQNPNDGMTFSPLFSSD